MRIKNFTESPLYIVTTVCHKVKRKIILEKKCNKNQSFARQKF